MRLLIMSVILLSWFPFTSFASPYKVVLVETMPVQVVSNHTQAVVSAFREMGYLEGDNLELEILQARYKDL